MSIFQLFELIVCYSQEMRFVLLEYHKTCFPGLFCLKQKGGKMANFETKPWTNPFGKMSIIGLFELLVVIAKKGVFSF